MLPPRSEFISVDFLAVDDQKNAMHGTIPSEYSDEFEHQLIEGHVYKIRMFQVTKRKQSHNALPLDKMLYFSSTTEIQEIKDDIDRYPHHYFQFATMEDIVRRTERESFMTDVIGLLTSITPISIVHIPPKQITTNVGGHTSPQILNTSKRDIFIKLLRLILQNT
ncbi:replication protein a 70 kDa DNA-binding subunit c [Phtheirospermum japonicum]|uniref:Replication protein a 70 kDa DNA-binding subunit c n=1 Tax=Phtheirospermum japonicum TaxID=374723 RepID=A0A830C7V2_9LAMI|nr:replication protein a 70 kDa DNA-binding subunit c [Phtheirospermum japonicum]